MGKAIIAAAGWKGVGRPGKPEIPAPFLPLGDGTTMLSRLSRQLQSHGFEVHIAVGALGYPFRAYQPRGEFRIYEREHMRIEDILAEIGVDPDASPWTDELHAYAEEYGKLVIMPDPGWSNQHDSFCEVMDTLDDWDRLIPICGDTLFSSDLLSQVIAMQWPFQFSMHHNHAIFLLDRLGARIYRKYTEPHRKRSATVAGWVGTTRLYPDGSMGSGMLGILGIEHRGWHSPPWKDLTFQALGRLWLDVDSPGGYSRAREKVEAGWFT